METRLEITKTVLSLMLVMITILTTLTLTTTITAYAGGDHHDGGDGNKQKAEDDSAAAIADCDDNDVERAGFDCIAIATNDVEIEPPSNEPPGESTTLFVCKEVEGNTEVEPNDFVFTITTGGNGIILEGQPPADCPPVGDELPGEYTVTEEPMAGVPPPDLIEVEGDCEQDSTNPQRATGELEEGETQTCTFINTYLDS